MSAREAGTVLARVIPPLSTNVTVSELGVDRRHGTRRYRRLRYRSRRRRLPACAASPWASPQPSPSPPATSRPPPPSRTSPPPTPVIVKTFRPDGTTGATLPTTSWWSIGDTRVAIDTGSGGNDVVDVRDSRTGAARYTIPHGFRPIVLPGGQVAFWPGRNGVRDPLARLALGPPRRRADPQAAAAARRRGRRCFRASFDGTGAARGGRQRQRRRPVPVRRLAARPQDGEDEAPDHRPQVALAGAAQRRRRRRLHAASAACAPTACGRPTSCC